MLRKFLIAALVLLMCSTLHADILYLDESSGLCKITADSSGNLASVPLMVSYDLRDLRERFIGGWNKVININSREFLVTLKQERDGSTETESSDTTVSVYETNNLSVPVSSKRFTYSELPYVSYSRESNIEVWGNNILIPCLDSTIVEIDPLSCAVAGRYKYDEGVPDYIIEGYGNFSPLAAPMIAVFRGKIYAAFESYNFEKTRTASITSSFRAADGGPIPYRYFVEMSSLGVISRELPQLYMSSAVFPTVFSDPRTIDGKLHLKYITPITGENGRPVSHDRGIYVFSNDINLASAKKIAFPKGVTVEENSAVCSDGSGGIYFRAYKYNDSYSDNSMLIQWVDYENVEEEGIYHYDGSSVSKVYTGTILSMVYDKALNTLFVSVPVKVPQEINGIMREVTTGNLLALRPDASGNLSTAMEIKNAYLGVCETVQNLPSSSNQNTNTNNQNTNTNNQNTNTNNQNTNTNNQSNSNNQNTSTNNQNTNINSNQNANNNQNNSNIGNRSESGGNSNSGGGGCNSLGGMLIPALYMCAVIRRKNR